MNISVNIDKDIIRAFQGKCCLMIFLLALSDFWWQCSVWGRRLFVSSEPYEFPLSKLTMEQNCLQTLFLRLWMALWQRRAWLWLVFLFELLSVFVMLWCHEQRVMKRLVLKKWSEFWEEWWVNSNFLFFTGNKLYKPKLNKEEANVFN